MKTLKITFPFIFVFLLTTQILAQRIQTLTWKDGTPSFQYTSFADSVRIDSVISLIPIPGFNEESSSFKFILDGLDWFWPEQIQIFSAEDIDYRSFLGTDLYLVTDGSGKKVIEIDPSAAKIVWDFSGTIGSSEYLEKPVDAYNYRESAIGGVVLITDQGRHRVIKVVRENKFIIWQYGNETEGTGFNQLSSPADAVAIPDSGLVFICDKGNNRIILVKESDKSIAWNYGADKLNNPVDVEYNSSTKEILITDQGNHRVIKVAVNTDSITWQFGTGLPDSLNDGLNLPSDADFLPNGNILICDNGNDRLIEMNKAGQIVWQFGTKLKKLKDADRLLDNKHLIVTNNLPSRIGYITKAFESEPRDIGLEVSFDSLFWFADTMVGFTSIKLQLRSANTLGDLASAPWLGPIENQVYYTKPKSAINLAHNGHRFYEFRAILETNDPLYTPVLNDVKITYRYYDTETTGRILSQEIRGSDELIITKWKSLRFNTILPQNPANRNKVELIVSIINSKTQDVLRSFMASNVNHTNEVVLSDIANLKKIQTIQLQATLNTNSTSATPILKNWEVEWEATPVTDAKINFVDENLNPASHYQVSKSFQPGQKYIDRVTVLLNDPNIIPIQDVVNLNITALQSQDLENINISLQPDGWYLLKPSIPAIILEEGIPTANDGFLQVFDRDKLIISYTDPITPTDVARDCVLVVKDTTGTIQFENKFFTKIDSVFVGDTIYVRILGETDRDLTSQQDTVSVIVFDYETDDQEELLLTELATVSGEYNTGEFLSIRGLPLVRSTTRINNDSLMQTFEGSRIGVDYDNTISETPILQILGVLPPPPTIFYSGTRSLDFDIAPNPFYGNQHDLLRIRVASSIGNITVEKIEVYNFAGQKLRELNSSQLTFYYNYPILVNQYSFADNWWNLKDQNGTSVSSGTYWVKVFGRVVNTDQSLSLIKKLVVIR